jgi:hypothetical protein
MLTHAEICTLVAASYTQKPTWQVADDIRAVGTRVGNEFVVAIPGTDDIAGWLDDFSFWPNRFPTIGIYHDGFGRWGLALAALIIPKVPQDVRLIISGHSLGGALGLVFAAVWAAAKNPPARVILFGCPRGAFIGNIVAGPLQRSALELVEYRTYGDPVPSLPPYPLWKHAKRGTMVGAPIHALAPSVADHNIALYQTVLA